MGWKIKLKDSDGLISALNNLASDKTDEIAKKALYEGMKPLADTAKSNLKAVIKDGNGDLVNSLGVSPIKKSESGGYDVALGVSGYDRKGVPNLLKARVLESGKSDQPKRPWMRPAINAMRATSIKIMDQIIDVEIRKITK